MKVDDSGVPHPESIEDVEAFFNDRSNVHYIVMLNPPRIGGSECITNLEFTHYPPLTPKNDLLHMRVFTWNDMTWAIVSIPAADAHLIHNMADQAGLRVADGVPVMFGERGIERFPFHGDQFFTLENKSGHPVYQNDREKYTMMLESELETMKRIREIAAKKE